MLSALIVRRFNVKTNGTAHVVEAARLLDLPALPLHGYVLVFEDGSGEAGVSAMRMHGWPSPRPTGVYPAAVEIRCGAERRLGVRERDPVTSRRVAHDARPWVAQHGRPCLAQFG